MSQDRSQQASGFFVPVCVEDSECKDVSLLSCCPERLLPEVSGVCQGEEQRQNHPGDVHVELQEPDSPRRPFH